MKLILKTIKSYFVMKKAQKEYEDSLKPVKKESILHKIFK